MPLNTVEKARIGKSQCEALLATPEFVSATTKEGFNSKLISYRELVNLSLASRTLFAGLKEAREARLKQDAHELLQHVVLGHKSEAKAMISENPNLLLIPSTALDYSGRTIIGTAFRAAIGAGDKPMYTMMLDFIEPQEALKQFELQFPNGFVGESAAALKPRYLALAHAIRDDADFGEAKIAEFREDITAVKEIKEGLHFNLQELVAARDAFWEVYDELSDPQRDKFCNEIYGYLERLLTTYDAKVFCSGIQSVLDEESALKDDVELIFPLDRRQDGKRLGFDFSVYSYYSARMLCSGRPYTFSTIALKDFVERKQMNLTSLESSLRQECTVSSVKGMDV
jgi:hypothetical protein